MLFLEMFLVCLFCLCTTAWQRPLAGGPHHRRRCTKVCAGDGRRARRLREALHGGLQRRLLPRVADAKVTGAITNFAYEITRLIAYYSLACHGVVQ
jgi:hypothetical protein